MSPFSGGDEGNRTPDLLLARQALSHLSYTPELLKLSFNNFCIRFFFSQGQSLKIEQQSDTRSISIPLSFLFF